MINAARRPFQSGGKVVAVRPDFVLSQYNFRPITMIKQPAPQQPRLKLSPSIMGPETIGWIKSKPLLNSNALAMP